MVERIALVVLLSRMLIAWSSASTLVVTPGARMQELDEASLIQTRTLVSNTESESDDSATSAAIELPNFYQVVPKPSTNNFARFVFFAGLGGTGHHGWQETMGKSSACIGHPAAEDHMRKLWYGDDSSVDLFFDKLVAELRDTTQHHINTGTKQLYCLNVLQGSMLSYPDCNSKRHHPDLVSLASAAAEAGADLRVVVMHRDPAPMLVSLSLHRNLLPLAEEANQMGNQAAILHAQLSSIDPNLFICVPFTGVVSRADQISTFVAGDLGQSFASAIHSHFIDKDDDVVKAREQITQHQKHILSKMKTWEAFHGLLLRECWDRTPEVAK